LATVAGAEEDKDAFVDYFNNFSRKWMSRVSSIERLPILLEEAPTVRENVRSSSCSVGI
jgi:hypothetical protein